ncbi:MAG TPA: F0F1 ATP synthase subunit gamma [Candidatus Saccharimonadales bacterium]|nr:F0F1 ATP synthase subunit gamma [Candidatus Saccharimonadales bacterium]
MRRANQIEKDSEQIETVEDLTGVFESIASTQVAKVKNKVELSKQFFQLIWARYTAVRFDPSMRITNRDIGTTDKTAFIVISGEAGLSGDIDQRLIESMLQSYDAKTCDIVVLGTHGATQLKQRGVPYIKFFKVPETDKYIDVSPVINIVLPYSRIIVYYEEYVSLGVQEVKTIDLISSMRDMSEQADEEVMTPFDTIFEPSLDEIAEQMEMTMMTLALSEAILESSLAQAASRFNAMAVAKKRALELLMQYQMEFHRAKRGESDRALREVMVSLKKKKHRVDAR